MFLKLPSTRWNSRKKEWIDGQVLLNPFHIIAIERDEEDVSCCLVQMMGDISYYIKLTPEGMRKKVTEFVKENVLSRIYNDMKDKQN